MADPKALFRFDLSQPQLNQTISQLQPEGWQLVSVAMYGAPSSPLYAAIWHMGLKRPWTIHFDITSGAQAEYVVASLGALGWHPALVSGTGSLTFGSLDKYRAIVVFEKYDPDSFMTPALMFAHTSFDAWHKGVTTNVTPSAPVDDYGLVRRTRWLPRSVDWFTRLLVGEATAAAWTKTYYCAVLEPQPPILEGFNVFRIEGEPEDGYDALRLGAYNRGMHDGWARMQHAVPSALMTEGKRQVLVDYRTNTFVRWPADMKEPHDGGTRVYGPMDRHSLQGAGLDGYHETAHFPISVGANGAGSGTRFCVTFATGRLEPLSRHWVVVDARDENPPAHVEGPRRSLSARRKARAAREEADRLDADQRGFDQKHTLSRMRHPERWGAGPRCRRGGGLPGGAAPGLSSSIGSGSEAESYLSSTMQPLNVLRLDAVAKKLMRNIGARNCQLTIARNGRAKYCRAFTFAEAGYPVARGACQ